MASSRKMSRAVKGPRGCDPECAMLHLAVQEMLGDPSLMVVGLNVDNGRELLLVDADRAAAVSTNAEGTAGLHDLLDGCIATLGDPNKSDYKG